MLAYDLDPAVLSRAPKTERMALRTSTEVKSLIESAAHALGLDTTEFVTAAACREARETLSKCETTRIPSEAAQAFVNAFERTEPTDALVDLMRLHANVRSAASRR